ncbi:MAG TPA: MarR family transcriptional regulator [Microbacteriaceae bacterium]
MSETQLTADRVALAAAVQALTRASRVLERASSELSLSDFRMLSAIADGEARATRLAARLAVGKPTVSAGIDSLERRRFVSRSSVEGDQRASALSLTDAGEDIRNRVEEAMMRRLEQLCARTPDGPGIVAALEHLGGAIEAVMTERAAE